MSPVGLEIAIALGAGLSACALIFAVFPKAITGRSRFDARLEEIAGPYSGTDARSQDGDDAKRRQRAVEKTLKELKDRQKRAKKKKRSPSFSTKMAQSRLHWSRSYFYAVSLMVFSILLAVGILLDLSLGLTAGMSVLGAAVLPSLYVNHHRKKVFKAFTAEFPTSIDVMVRGIRSGLPLNDCIETIGKEGAEPLRSEFIRIVDDQQVGIPISDAVQRMADRMPTVESAFFATVITMQTRTGGNLSEALSNLSNVMRGQMKMRAKIKSMSAEAKASGGIIGSLPPLVAVGMYLTNPEYISVLFTSTTGTFVLVGSGLWMLTGILVMKKMINFDF